MEKRSPVTFQRGKSFAKLGSAVETNDADIFACKERRRESPGSEMLTLGLCDLERGRIYLVSFDPKSVGAKWRAPRKREWTARAQRLSFPSSPSLLQFMGTVMVFGVRLVPNLLSLRSANPDVIKEVFT